MPDKSFANLENTSRAVADSHFLQQQAKRYFGDSTGFGSCSCICKITTIKILKKSGAKKYRIFFGITCVLICFAFIC